MQNDCYRFCDRILVRSVVARFDPRRFLKPGPQAQASSVALKFVAALVLIVVAAQTARTQTFTVLHNFTGGGDGSTPYAGLAIDAAGNLYGTTSGGGLNTVGVVFKMENPQRVLIPLYSFKGYGGDGAVPYARVLRDSNGIVYGSTVAGGNANFGTVFQLRPSATRPISVLSPWAERQLYSFTGGNDGRSPFGDLAFDYVGNLYGTTNAGGTSNIGVVFQLVPTGGGDWTENVIYNFNGGDGAYPFAGVTFDPAGNLYGTAYQGGHYNYGTVYELSPSESGWIETTLYSFAGDQDGGNPKAGVIRDALGNLYGATTYGGSGGGGTIFELSPSGSGWTYTLLYAFTGNSYAGPQGNLTMDEAGKLYGATVADGRYGYGNVFELAPSTGGWIFTDLYDLTGRTDGGYPYDGLVLDTEGNIYGTASYGGIHNLGVVFEVMP